MLDLSEKKMEMKWEGEAGRDVGRGAYKAGGCEFDGAGECEDWRVSKGRERSVAEVGLITKMNPLTGNDIFPNLV